jgi:hypothetical protein
MWRSGTHMIYIYISLMRSNTQSEMRLRELE